MKLIYTSILFIQIICMIASLKPECACDKTPPKKCTCKKCGCANED